MRILLFCDFALPDSCANSTRVICFSNMLTELGHSVELLGVSYNQSNNLSGSYDGISYEMLSVRAWTGIKAYKRIRELSLQLEAYLEEHSVSSAYDVILLSNVYYDLSNIFLRYSRRYNSAIVVNSVEWYDKKNDMFSGALGKIKYVKNRLALRCIHVRMGNILAISTLLDGYYKSRGCNTVTIPTVLDMYKYDEVASIEKKYGDVIHIAYAGNPGRKDYIVNAIYALELLSKEERARVRFDFYGPSDKELSVGGVSPELLKKYKDNIICHGRIPHDEVKKRIADADFTVLLRPDMRYANAGFPTKVGESMACGTPVIANITSDLGKYIIDGKTGIVCENESKEACAVAIRRALAMTDEQRVLMRNETLSMAKKAFDYKTYLGVMEEFLNRAAER